MSKVKNIIIILLGLIIIYLFITNNNNKVQVVHHYQKDSVFYRQIDSIHNVLDTNEVILKKINTTYEKRIEIIKHLPIDSAYIFWANYVQRFQSDNDSSTITNN